MQPGIVQAIQSFEEEGKILFSQVDDSTCVLIPVESGSTILVQDLEDFLCVRTGVDIRVALDPEEDGIVDLLVEVLGSLRSGKATERFQVLYRSRIAPAGYTIEYPSGKMQEMGDRQGREFSVRLPEWNAE